MDSKLMKAILAMDSYNRGYNAGIVFGDNSESSEEIIGVTKIGNYTVLLNSTAAFADDAAESIGFYAIAYEYNGEVIVSYRGTDDFLDIVYGWPVGAGLPFGDQADMSFDFYNEVALQAYNQSLVSSSNPYLAGISVTGHSMGGGFAALAGAVYQKG